MLLRAFGLDPACVQAREAVRRVHDQVAWEHDGEPFFAGEVEPCINGKVVALGAYFGQDIQGIVDRLGGEQMSDGGWNCEQENGSTRGSFHSTIDVLDGLLEYERTTRDSPKVRAARLRGEEYLLEREMLRRQSTGELIDPAFTQFPTRRTGTTMCSGASTTCARPAPFRMSGWPRRSTWSSPSAMRMAAGPSRIPIPAGRTLRWTRAKADQAGGTPSGPCVCSGGTSRLHDRLLLELVPD